MPDRFYAPSSFDSEFVELSQDESEHLSRVLRKAEGDTVVIFDGRGVRADARVIKITRRTVTLQVLQAYPATVRSGPRIELATAVPKGDRAKWLVEKATELGADRWQPLQTVRSVVDPRATRLDRLRQTVIAGCKQSDRDDLMEIGPLRLWSDWLSAASAAGPVLVADRSGRPAPAVLRDIEAEVNASEQLAIAIGPEGGLTDEELSTATTVGARTINLGSNILRIETAALAALAWMRPELEQRSATLNK